MHQNSLTYPPLFLFLGAGASMDLGFPSGLSLRNKIRSILTTRVQSDLKTILSETFQKDVLERLTLALEDPHDSRGGRSKEERSIDAILNEHKGDAELVLAAKVAIRHLILEHERRVTDGQISAFWLTRFFDEYLRRCEHPEALHFPGRDGQFLNNLGVCTLNYDRLFEHTLRLWCARRFKHDGFMGMSPFESGLSIVFHAHGSVGKYFGSEPTVPFGSSPPHSPDEARKGAGEMKLWFELSDKCWDWSITNRLIDLRPDLLILGCGFHDVINRRFASCLTDDRRLMRIISTAYDVAASKRAEIRRRFSESCCLSEDCIELLPERATCADAISFFIDSANRPRRNGMGRGITASS